MKYTVQIYDPKECKLRQLISFAKMIDIHIDSMINNGRLILKVEIQPEGYKTLIKGIKEIFGNKKVSIYESED